jgi:hypothetical protein
MIQHFTKEEKETMYDLVRRWKESGMTQISFALQNNLSVHVLRYWKNKYYNLTNKKPSFIELPINIPQPTPDEITLRYPNGIELTLPVDFPIESIKTLMAC